MLLRRSLDLFFIFLLLNNINSAEIKQITQPSTLLCSTLRSTAKNIISNNPHVANYYEVLTDDLLNYVEKLVEANNNLDAAILAEKLSKPKNEQETFIFKSCGGSEERVDHIIKAIADANDDKLELNADKLKSYFKMAFWMIDQKSLESRLRSLQIIFDAQLIDANDLGMYMFIAVERRTPQILDLLLKQKDATKQINRKRRYVLEEGKTLDKSLFEEALEKAIFDQKNKSDCKSKSLAIAKMLEAQNPKMGEREIQLYNDLVKLL